MSHHLLFAINNDQASGDERGMEEIDEGVVDGSRRATMTVAAVIITRTTTAGGGSSGCEKVVSVRA